MTVFLVIMVIAVVFGLLLIVDNDLRKDVKNISPYNLEKYDIYCNNQKQVKDCFKKLTELEYDCEYEEDENCNVITHHPWMSKFTNANSGYDNRKSILYDDFIKLCDYMLKKAISVNVQGQVLAINNYNVNRYVYIVDLSGNLFKSESYLISNLKKSFIEPLMKMGYVFKDQESLNETFKNMSNLSLKEQQIITMYRGNEDFKSMISDNINKIFNKE